MQDKNILIKNWLLKSDEAFEDAKKSINLDMLSTAQSRLYYAIFYAVSSLAQKNDFATSKHSQLLGWFNREYVKKQLISADIAEIYKTTFEFRHKSDYTFTFKPNKQYLLEDLKKAEEFIKVIKELLQIG